MDKPLADAVRAERRLLANQYAHIDYLEELQESNGLGARAPSEAAASKSGAHRLSDLAIERRARELQRRLWEKATSGGRSASGNDPVDILDPEFALHSLGYSVDVEDGLGQYRTAAGVIEVAGLIDNKTKSVRLSGQFPRWIRRFTAAHELGHAVLHPSMGTVHRDKPLDGVSVDRDSIEREADRFAAYFLMPRKLLIRRFEESFGARVFALTEESAFALFGTSASEVSRSHPTVRHLARALANAKRFNGRHFVSLADQFGVSDIAMAIRLEGLRLVE